MSFFLNADASFTAVEFGPDAALIRVDKAAHETAFARCRKIVHFLEEKPPAGLLEVVPAFASVLLRFYPGKRPQAAWFGEFYESLENGAIPLERESRLVEIPVRYDGADLPTVAEAHALRKDEVIALHSATIYQVYSIGFAPGFPYLGDLDPRLQTPRLAVPRTRVPAGSVAIGGAHTGIYPFATPGGWNLIGTTDLVLFDPMVEVDFCRLHAGDRVKFIPV